MRTDLPPPGDSTRVSQSITCMLYRTGTPRDLIRGTSGLTTTDLTAYVTSARQGSADASITCTHRTELAGASRPKPGQLVEFKNGTSVIWRGVVEAVSAEREARGERSLTITARTRDAWPGWRDTHRISELFAVGADLASMARSVAAQLMLAPDEYVLPNLGVRLVHDNAQLADIPAWEMLTTVLQPCLREPFVDALGVLKSRSRDVRRPPTLTLTYPLVQSMSSGGSAAPLTSVTVKWLDPNLSEVDEQAQAICVADISCGFFNEHPRKPVWFSADHTRRAKDTVLVEQLSINAGPIPVGNVSWEQTSELGGTLKADIGGGLPILITAGAITELGTIVMGLPDEVVVGGFLGGAGVTVPWGRLTQQLAVNAILIGLATVGHGTYEIHGTPYDYVHAINETVAYDENAPAYVDKAQTIENDLVPDEPGAQSLAINELLYQAKQAIGKGSVVIADDLRIEPGDILGLPDGRRLYVQDYSRELTRGAESLLTCDGFYL